MIDPAAAKPVGNLFQHLVARERAAAPVLMPRAAGRFESAPADESSPPVHALLPALSPAIAPNAAFRAGVGAGSKTADAPMLERPFALPSPTQVFASHPLTSTQHFNVDVDVDPMARQPKPSASPHQTQVENFHLPLRPALHVEDDADHSALPLRAEPGSSVAVAPTRDAVVKSPAAVAPQRQAAQDSPPIALTGLREAARQPAPTLQPGPAPRARVAARVDSAPKMLLEAAIERASEPSTKLPLAPSINADDLVRRAGLPVVDPTATPAIPVPGRAALFEPAARTMSAANNGERNVAAQTPPPAVEHTVHVSIGRIELRTPAPASATPARRSTPSSAAVSLADYLRRRGG